MTIIQTEKLTKYYLNGKVLGVKDLTLKIEEGEIFGFIGPNGAGKSTTIRLLLDFIRPTLGKAMIFGLDVNKKDIEIKKEIGYLSGEIFLSENMTGLECVNFYSHFKKKIEGKYLDSLVDRFNLDLTKRISTYSKGNKQKLAIILALMHKPRVLILDEPTSGLDPLNQQEFYDSIKETKKWGATTFFSTHILTEAQKMCDRVGIIKDGNLIKIENIDDFEDKNIREIIIQTKDSIPLSALQMSGVKKIERTTAGYHLTTLGKNGTILKQLAKFSVEDIKISEPSLEDIFMQYYKENK